MSAKFYPLPFSVTLWCVDIALQSVKPPKKKKKGPGFFLDLFCRLVFVGLGWVGLGCGVEKFQSFLRPFNMSQLFPRSILLHFPSEINLRRSVGELFPLLVRALYEKEIVAMQFLRGGRVRVTVRSEAYREDLLSSEFRYEDTVVPVTPADCVAKSVYVRDLPFEVSDKSIVSVFSTYGKVYSVKSVYHKEFPSICTGTRTVLMSVNDSVPSIVNVNGFECRVWYPGQPAFCSVCRSSGHLPRACPLSGLCRCCKQPGHVARECVQALIQPRPLAPVASDPVVPDVSSEEEEDSSSVSSEVVEPHPPSAPDPVPPAPSSPPVPSSPSASSVSSSLSPEQITLKRLICKSLPQPPNCTLTWSSPEINSFVDGLLSQSSFSVSLRDFAVSYVSRLIFDYQKEVADARKSKCP